MTEYRLSFNKKNNLKYLSHLDLIRTMERAIRRGRLPVVYSEGFHPHPKLSFGPALAVGISSRDEYLDLQLAQSYEPQEIKETLNRVLPEGLEINVVKQIKHRVKPLNAVINRAQYQLALKVNPDLVFEAMSHLNGFLEMSEINLVRNTKDGQKLVNIRPWLHNLKIERNGPGILLVNLVGEIGSGGNLRPEEIIKNIPCPVEVVKIERISLWHEEKGLVIKPMEFCE